MITFELLMEVFISCVSFVNTLEDSFGTGQRTLQFNCLQEKDLLSSVNLASEVGS